MANKTAMQQLIDWMIEPAEVGSPSIYKKATELLELEKNQIIQAGDCCGNMLIANDLVTMGDHELSVGENYYNDTYQNK